MSIKLFLSANLSRVAKGTEGFEVDGETVGECVDELVSLVPAMRNALFYESRLNHECSRCRLTRRASTEGSV